MTLLSMLHYTIRRITSITRWVVFCWQGLDEVNVNVNINININAKCEMIEFILEVKQRG